MVHHWFVHSGPLVLGAAPFKSLAPAMDRDRTVSRRSEPSSRTTLMGEQPNPWDRLQPQDVMSRHRGAIKEVLYHLSSVIIVSLPLAEDANDAASTFAGAKDAPVNAMDNATHTAMPLVIIFFIHFPHFL